MAFVINVIKWLLWTVETIITRNFIFTWTDAYATYINNNY